LSASEQQTGLSADLVVTNDDRHALSWQQHGAKKVINLPISGIDPAGFKTPTAKTIPVSFVASLFPDRQQQLQKIIKLYPDLKIWGCLPPKVKLLPSLKAHYQGEAWGAKLRRIYAQSLISLNLSPTHMQQGGNIRTFEIAGSQALLLTDQLNPEWYREGKEAIVFTSAKDCVQKIHYYLSHPQLRKAIALKGYLRTIKDHTYLARFSRLIADIKLPVLLSA
jgi:spore maturation protein CgeB